MALRRRELIICLSNNEARIRRCIQKHSCPRCCGKVPPGAGVDCFVSAVVGDNDIIPNLTPGVESLLREVLRGCCDYYDRVNVDLVFKVIETASKKVREKDWRLWKSLVGGASAKCVLRATLREQMLRWLLSREVDQIAGSQLLEGVLELADPHDTGVIERDNFIKATGLCGGTDILCSENIPTILSWIQRLNTSCHAGARESSTVASSKDDCELREFPYYVTDDSHSSTVTVPEVDAQSQLYRSTVTDMGPAYDVSGSTITELQQFPGESAQSVVAALLKPVHRRLWSSLVYITLGSNRNYMTKTPAVVSLLHLAVVRRIAWALSRMTARTMVREGRLLEDIEDESGIHYAASHLRVARQAAALASACTSIRTALRRSLYFGWRAVLILVSQRPVEENTTTLLVNSELSPPTYDLRHSHREHVIALPVSPLPVCPPKPGSIHHSVADISRHSSPVLHAPAAESSNLWSPARQDSWQILPQRLPHPAGNSGVTSQQLESRYTERISEPRQQTPIQKFRKKQPISVNLFA